MIRFVYFDVGGVILRWKTSWEAMSIQTGKSLDDLFKAHDKHNHLAERGVITLFQFWDRVKKELNIDEDEQIHYPTFIMKHFQPIKETHAFIKELIEKKIKVGLLTNIYHGVYIDSIKHGHIPKVPYHVVVESCAIGMIKPEKDIYVHAQEKAKVKPDEILFVDDLPQNILAAKKMGWEGIVFDTDHPEQSIAKIRSLLG